MKFIVDQDLHIHSHLSLCSNDAEQTKENILKYAVNQGLKTICLADHFWDKTVGEPSVWYSTQDYEHIAKSLPLPQTDGVRFLFGCETELDKNFRLGISAENYDKFDFIVIPTTHLHMTEFTIPEECIGNTQKKADLWVERLACLLDMNLPFNKVGIAHLACSLIERNEQERIKLFNLIPHDKMDYLFSRLAKLGVGIELNVGCMRDMLSLGQPVYRIFKSAKDNGCKFYTATDSHHPKNFVGAKAIFERAVEVLELEEKDKFRI